MFWNSLVTSPQIDLVLDQPAVTLDQVLDLDELLQECRVGHRRLLEFLQRGENLLAMLDYITVEPSKEMPIATQYKFPNVVCEVLTSDITFAEKIAADRVYLEKLFHFFKREADPPLNPLLASYVCRVLTEVISRKPDQNWYSYKLNTIQLLGYLTETETDVIELLLTHLGTSSVCDFIYKLIMNLEGEDTRVNLLQWLEKSNFVLRLMKKMGDGDAEVHEGVDRLVNDLLNAFRDDLSSSQDRTSDADPLFVALKSPKTVEVLFGAMMGRGKTCESSIKYGLNLVVALMGIPRTQQRANQQKSWVPLHESQQDVDVDPEVQVFVASRFQSLYNLLCVEPKGRPPLFLTYGEARCRVGTMRLAVVKFFAHMASLRNPGFIDEMIHTGVLRYLVGMFWYNEWNGFLHRDIEKILLNILLMPLKNSGVKYILDDVNILYNVMDVFKKPKSKCGIRGHLARFACVYTEVTSKPGYQKDVVTLLEESRKDFFAEWNRFLLEDVELYLKNERAPLAGVMVPHAGAPANSQTVTSETDHFSDINAWGDLKSSDDFGVFSDSDIGVGKDMFEMFWSKENGLDGNIESDAPLPEPSENQFDEEEWQSSDTLLKELEGLYT